MGRSFSLGFSSAFVADAAFAGIVQIGRFLRGAREEAEEARKITRLTEAAIKSTHGAARVSAAEIGTIADQLSKMAAVDDEAIQGAENILLTFTNIRNRGPNKIFNEAAAAVVDMTAGLNQGDVSAEKLRGSALLLGKALNDPVKGMTALRRAGVSFTQAQIEQVKHLVATGRTMDAQKLILAELKTEFAGAAAAAADPAEKASIAWANFKERIGGFLLPVIGRLSTVFTDKLLPAVEQRVIPAVAMLVHWLVVRLGPFVRNQLIPALTNLGRRINSDVVPAAVKLAQWFGREVLPVLRDLGLWIATQLMPRMIAFGIWIHRLLVPVLEKLVTVLVAGVKSAVASLSSAVRDNREQLLAVANVLKVIVEFVVTKVLPVLGPILRTMFKVLGVEIRVVITIIGSFIRAIMAVIDAAKAAWRGVSGAFGAVVDFFKGLPGTIRGAVGDVSRLLYDVGADIVRGLWDGIKSLGGWLADKVSGFIENTIPGPVKKVLGIGSPSKLMRGYGRDTVRGFWLGVKDETHRTQQIMASAVRPKPPAPGEVGALGAGRGMHVGQVIVKAFTDRFSLRQVQDELALHGVS